MIDFASDTQSLTTFVRHPARILKQLKRTGRPIALTVQGKTEAVVQSAEAYERLLDLVDHAETMAAIRSGLDDVAHWRTIPAKEVFDRIRRKYSIPR